MYKKSGCSSGSKKFLGKCLKTKPINYSSVISVTNINKIDVDDFIIGGTQNERAKWYKERYESNLRSGALYKVIKNNPKSLVVIEASDDGWNNKQKARLSKEGWGGGDLDVKKLLVQKLPKDYRRVLLE